MFCPRCGDTNHDSDRFCSFCGQDLTTYRQLWAAPAASTAAAAHAAAPAAAAPSAWPPAAPPPPPAALSLAAPQAAPPSDTPQVPSYLGWAAALLALCWPAFWAGVPALIYAGRTESLLAAGDIAGAKRSSLKAKAWCWVTFVAGVLLWVAALTFIATV